MKPLARLFSAFVLAGLATVGLMQTALAFTAGPNPVVSQTADDGPGSGGGYGG